MNTRTTDSRRTPAFVQGYGVAQQSAAIEHRFCAATVLAVCLASLLAACVTTPENARDIRSVAADLTVPRTERGAPAPGRRVRQAHPAYAGTAVHHTIYLPPDWQTGRSYPVLVEYTGNGNYRNDYGDVCSGRVEDAVLGYGITGGRGFIWIVMPYLNEAGTANVTRWWGDKPSYRPDQTIAYAKKTVPWICAEYGGDPRRVILAGFSRGSIACNYIGLHDDDIARLWRGFICYSVYDGVKTTWPYPAADRASAVGRLRRLGGRPQIILDEISPRDSELRLAETKAFIRSSGVGGNFTFVSTGFRNHNHAWVLRPSAVRVRLRRWLAGVSG